MTWVAAGVASASMTMAAVGGIGSFISGNKAQKKQEKLMKELQRKLNMSIGEIETLADTYTNTLTDLEENFDIYNMEEAFNSLYEGVIQPMERDFDENVLPGIQQAYAGGVMGQGAGLSGAQAEAESKAQRGLSETKAGLRAGERDKAISRNIGERGFLANNAGAKFDTQKQAPLLRMQADQAVYTGKSANIASALQNTQNAWNFGSNVMEAGVGGYSAGMGISGAMSASKGISQLNARGNEVFGPKEGNALDRYKYEEYLKSIGR